ncbi:MAG: PadR family transcriptional regulator [Planctomycetes bacterium]|jgi:PadR family transcriptional regulator PadR|nr:PadR family transcriptional regulator [Planctomycetota bacterium]
MADERFQILPGTLELLVLRVLLRGELHGYGIAQAIQQRSKDVLQVEEGSLYPALHRMEKRGLLEATWGLSEANRRAKYYGLTRKGRGEYAAQSQGWERMTDAVANVLRAGAPS